MHSNPGVRYKTACRFCGRTFRRKEHLERHLRTHTKEKPFRCDCGEKFARRDLLSRHVRLNHPNRSNSSVSPVDRVAGLGGNEASQSTRSTFVAYVPPEPLDTASGTKRRAQWCRGTSPLAEKPPSVILPIAEAQEDINNDYEDNHLNVQQELEISEDSPLERQQMPPGAQLINPEISAPIQETSTDDSPFRSWLPSVPSLGQGVYTVHDSESHGSSEKFPAIEVDELQRSYIAKALEPYKADIPGFQLPSRHTLTRYLTSFFQGFNMHLLCIHVPTFRLTDRTPEFILAMMAAGAQYRFEHQNASKFFQVARNIICRKLDTQAVYLGSPKSTRRHAGKASHGGENSFHEMEIIRCLLVLMGFATWEGVEMLQEAFRLRGTLTEQLRSCGLEETEEPQACNDWLEWVNQETIRRTKMAAFGFVDTYGVAYNVYPTIRNHEVKLRLPCQGELWNAANATEWQAAKKVTFCEQLYYHDALAQLLRDSTTATVLTPRPSPLGNFYIMHGLIQRVHILRELSLDLGYSSTSLPADEVNRLECALHSWTLMWQQAPESSLDPANENGPIPFTSSLLLALAYVRLSLNLGPCQKLETRDPSTIARSLMKLPPLQRCARLTPALIYAIHTFSIPVRLGLDYVACSQAFFWSVRHALSSFECVVFLSEWLQALAADPTPALSANEKRIVRWTRLVVEEAYDSMDLGDDDAVPGRTPGELSLAVLAIWSRFFIQNSQWRFINILGESLSGYAGFLSAA